MIVVATAEEAVLAKQELSIHYPILITGVGGVNVIRALDKIPRTTKIVNFGFAGSNLIPKGQMCRVGSCKMHHPNVEYEEPIFRLDGDIECLTSDDFILSTQIKKPVLFDMELAYILAMGFEVTAYKYVSDNLNADQYNSTVEGI